MLIEYFYRRKDILKETDTIENGIGTPDLLLTLCLILSWTFIGIVLLNGIKSSGKVAYFLAVFPYIVLIILLIRAMTLEGAMDGVRYFIIPEWEKLFEAKLWYFIENIFVTRHNGLNSKVCSSYSSFLRVGRLLWVNYHVLILL